MASEASLIGQMTSNTFGDSSVSAFDFFGISRPHRWSETLRVFAFPCFMFIFTEHPINLELCGGKSESVPHPQNMTDWAVLPLSVLKKKKRPEYPFGERCIMIIHVGHKKLHVM